MDGDLLLHQELEARIARFGKTNPIEKKHDKVLDTMKILSDLEQTLKAAVQQRQLHLCGRKHPCKCPSAHLCICDHDEYVTVTHAKADILSNCLYTIHLTYTGGNLKIQPQKEAVRCFILSTEKDEQVVFDMFADRFHVVQPPTTFRMSDPPTNKFQSLIMTFNYMDYT